MPVVALKTTSWSVRVNAPPVTVNPPVAEATVIAAEPSKETPPMFRAVAKIVALPAVKDAAVPEIFVPTKADGVPAFPLNVMNAPAEPTLTARAVATPVPSPVIPPTATLVAVAAFPLIDPTIVCPKVATPVLELKVIFVFDFPPKFPVAAV